MSQNYILLLNWNGWRDTLRCLNSLEHLCTPCHVLVIDNASTDDSVARLQEAKPGIEILQSGGNLGFAGGNNVGIREAMRRGADFIWLLNNDTVVEPTTLQGLLDVAVGRPDVGIVGSVIRDMEEPRNLQAWGGGRVVMPLGYVRHYLKPTEISRTSYITGASMLIRREVVEQIGLLDEHFFMYWEDTDYCFRARSAGWKLAVADDSVVYHAESSSAGKASQRQIGWRNSSARHFFKRHSSLGQFPAQVGILARSLKAVWQRRKA